jgi:hypothetical protein
MDLLSGVATGAAQGTQYLGPNAGARLDREQRGKEREAAIKEAQADREARAAEAKEARALQQQTIDIQNRTSELQKRMMEREGTWREEDKKTQAEDKEVAKTERDRAFKMEQGDRFLRRLDSAAGRVVEAGKLKLALKQAKDDSEFRRKSLDIQERTYDDQKAQRAYDMVADIERRWMSLYEKDADRKLQVGLVGSEIKNGIAMVTGQSLIKMAEKIALGNEPDEVKLRKMSKAIEVGDTVRRTIEAMATFPNLGTEDGFKAATTMTDAFKAARKAATDAIVTANLTDPAEIAELGSSIFNSRMENFLRAAQEAGANVPPKMPPFVVDSIEDIKKNLAQRTRAAGLEGAMPGKANKTSYRQESMLKNLKTNPWGGIGKPGAK